MASPWITVLADLAEHSTPIGYGAATLVALQRLLRMVMTWQRHRQDIVEKELQLEDLRSKLQEDRQQRQAQARSPQLDVSPMISRDIPKTEDPSGSSRDEELLSISLEQALRAAQRMGEILAAELIDPDDPRAAGRDAE
jgi:hypothetical protein